MTSLPRVKPSPALSTGATTGRRGAYDRRTSFSHGQAAGAPKRGAAARAPVDLVTYYTRASMDYRAWSRNLNMHFGFYRWGMNPLALESMVEEMSRQVFRRLGLRDGMKVLDLGCGLGAPARSLIRRRDVAVTAVSNVEYQVAMARKLSRGLSALGTVDWMLGDYTALGLPGGEFQAAFSIEASCHAKGADKEPFVRECSRLLAPGAKLVIADGFMKGRFDLPLWYATLLGCMTRGWAVERFADLPAFCACLERHGFTVLAAEDVSWRIAPSVAHVPRVTLEFLVEELLLHGGRLDSVRWGHVVAALLSPWIGLGRPYFGYYLVTARKRRGPRKTGRCLGA